MFFFIDKLIEAIVKNKLHDDRNKILDKVVNKFKAKYPDHPAEELIKKLNTEANRIYTTIDRSIIRARVKRASYAFWSVVIITGILIAIFKPISTINISSLISPFVVALVNYIVSIITIPISYNQRVKGSMYAILESYEKTLPSPENIEEANVEINLENDEIMDNNLIVDNTNVEHIQIENNESIKKISEELPKLKVTYLTKNYYQNGYFKSKSESELVQIKNTKTEVRKRSSESDLLIKKNWGLT